jgi:hypothetical protein
MKWIRDTERVILRLTILAHLVVACIWTVRVAVMTFLGK